MKCNNCGYIFNGDFDRCPYCGEAQHVKEKNILHTSISLGKNSSIRVKSVVYALLINLFILALMLDIFIYHFAFPLTLGAYVLCFGVITVVSIIYDPRSLFSSFERIDLFFLAVLIIASITLKIGTVDLREIITYTVVPIFISVSVVITTLLLIFCRGEKFRPLVAEGFISLRLAASIILLVFTLIALDVNGRPSWLNVNIGVFHQTLAAVAFILSTLLFLNYNLVLTVNIINKVKYIYGK